MIVWIDGPIHAGKTTVAQRFALTRPKTVHIEIDQLRHIATQLPLEACIPFCIEDAAELTRRWIDRGFHVVLSWPLSKDNLARFESMVAQPVRAFTLLPPRHVALAQRGKRILNHVERERIKEMYDTGMFDHPAGVVIDNQGETPEQTVERILKHLAASAK
ncbi:MAG: hypothetical protein AAGE65_08555 [Planctomycetota bacterium]